MTAPTGRMPGSKPPAAVLWLTVALVVAVLALVIVGIALLAKDKVSPTADRPAASPSSDDRLASTSDDWIAAVCELGTYQNGKGGNVLSGSTGSALCYGTARGTIFVGTYESEFRFDNVVARFQGNDVYATLSDDAGQVWVFYSPNGADLAPLTQFGFTLQNG